MIKFTKELQQQLNEQLGTIHSEQNGILKVAERAVSISQEFVWKLKQFVDTYTFKDQQEEIQFFKEIKPAIFSNLIYYLDMYNIESKMPPESPRVKRKYFIEEIKKLNTYFEQNIEFYKYYRTNSRHLDTIYFLRNNTIILNLDAVYFDRDPSFVTSHDYHVSRILANERIRVYVEEQLFKLKENLDPSFEQIKSSITWTGSKTALVELIYALHATGVIDNGQAEVKKIIEIVEQTFNIDLGDFYHTYMEIKRRKSNPNKFLEQLNKSFLKKITE
jgi:hypothetical protein